MLIIAGTITVDPSDVEALTAAAVEMMRATRAEPGNLAYAFSRDLGDPRLVHVFEQWQDDEALAAHFKTPHMAEFQRQIAGKAKSMELRKHRVSSSGPIFE